ncbi:MAG: glycosyltransferase, partial [Muribaculaceae bacterium]|nr:glycosyltransferase [Muribaculaceae bacterium]
VMVPAWCGGPRKDLAESLGCNCSQTLSDPIITHIINNPESDPIYGRIHSLGFSQNIESSVNVIYVPCYLNDTDGIFNTPYYGLLPGMDATVFPSYYEPWGYTPLESVAFGVPTITTTLSGFGQWVKSDCGHDLLSTGVDVINRTDGNYWSVAEEIAGTLTKIADGTYNYSNLSKAAVKTAEKADWAHFINYYTEAFTIALANENKRNK